MAGRGFGDLNGGGTAMLGPLLLQAILIVALLKLLARAFERCSEGLQCELSVGRLFVRHSLSHKEQRVLSLRLRPRGGSPPFSAPVNGF